MGLLTQVLTLASTRVSMWRGRLLEVLVQTTGVAAGAQAAFESKVRCRSGAQAGIRARGAHWHGGNVARGSHGRGVVGEQAIIVVATAGQSSPVSARNFNWLPELVFTVSVCALVAIL